jgi:hypothetical protein
VSVTTQHTIWCDGVVDDDGNSCANWIMESGNAGAVLKIAKARRWRRVRIAHSSLDLCPACVLKYLAKGLIKPLPEKTEVAEDPTVERIGVFQLMERSLKEEKT